MGKQKNNSAKIGRSINKCKAYANAQTREKNKFARLMKHILLHTRNIRMNAASKRIDLHTATNIVIARIKDALAALRKLVAVLPGTITKAPLAMLNHAYSIKV